MMRFTRIRTAALVASTVLACLPVRTIVAQAAAQQGAMSQPPIVLGPGDVVKVNVWQEKDLTCECRVDDRGRLTLPMIGTVQVLGKPWEDLRDSLLTRYQQELRNPSVSLTPFRRVQVLGEVTKPGQYLADPTQSLAGVVALAGGATPNGDLRHVRVVRGGTTIVKSASIESLLLQAGVQSNDQVFVDRRPWLERNGAFVASALISTASILVALIRR